MMVKPSHDMVYDVEGTFIRFLMIMWSTHMTGGDDDYYDDELVMNIVIVMILMMMKSRFILRKRKVRIG